MPEFDGKALEFQVHCGLIEVSASNSRCNRLGVIIHVRMIHLVQLPRPTIMYDERTCDVDRGANMLSH